jgi:hypothetical protein
VAVITTSPTTGRQVEEVMDVGGPAGNVDVDGTAAVVAVAGQRPALVILDFSGSRPRTVRRITLPAGTFLGGAAFSGARVAVAARDRGVLLFDR